MILLDANILIYGYNKADPRHEQAKNWLDALFTKSDLVGIPWVTIWAFLRITTNSRATSHPISSSVALAIVDSWTSRSNVVVVNPGSQHQNILSQIVSSSQASGPLVTDAVLAALAIEHGATLASTDLDFSRFATLKWINPLAL